MRSAFENGRVRPDRRADSVLAVGGGSTIGLGKAIALRTGMPQLAEMRELSGGKPVGFKLCVGSRREFLAVCKAMTEEGTAPDSIIVDGAEGGTGAAPLEFADHLGSPSPRDSSPSTTLWPAPACGTGHAPPGSPHKTRAAPARCTSTTSRSGSSGQSTTSACRWKRS